MNHQIGRVGFDDLRGLRFADDMALLRISTSAMEVTHANSTMSAPNFALAIAEKYGAPV